MIRSIYLMAILILCIVCGSCKRNKPKPVSTSITKTSVLVNGKKDSVINNPQKNYGNATVAEPCVKCLIQVIQGNDKYKAAVASVPVKNITYVVNWVEASAPPHTTNKQAVTNGLKVDVIDKGVNNRLISSFIYDNSLSKMYFVDKDQKNSKIPIDIDKTSLKKIRDKCYWGVASSK